MEVGAFHGTQDRDVRAFLVLEFGQKRQQPKRLQDRRDVFDHQMTQWQRVRQLCRPTRIHASPTDLARTFDGWPAARWGRAPRAARGLRPTRHTSTFPGTMLSSVFARLALLYTSAAAGSYTCPGSSAYIHASARVTALANATCDAVREEMLARVHGQPTAWHDPHNNGTYAVYSQSTDKVTFTRLTGNHKYTDKLTFVFQESDGASCLLHGCCSRKLI